jgi:hypothetical protein
MKLYRLFTVAATAVAMTSTVSAQGKSAGAAKAPHVTASASKGGQTTHGPKAGGQGSTKKPATTTASTSPDGSNKSGKGRSKTSTSETSTTTPATTTAAADAVEPNPVSIKIGNNPAQLAKIQPQLDAMGLTLEEATKGFRNQGQFIAALNASKNHSLDFVALQEAMTVEGLSLGQAAKKVQNTPPEPEPETPPAPTGSTGTTGTTGTTGQAQ